MQEQEQALPTQLQQYVHLSRYARWLENENRRETWEETVSRYTNFFAARFPGLYPADRINESIRTLRTMPSMRALMTAGPALDKDEMAGFNPVSAGTKVLTREYGLVPIEQLEGRCATVLNKDGRWAEATFRGYGVQPTKRVRFRRNSNTELHVDCTANHRWVLTTGEVKSTATLAVGDTIPHAAAPKPALDEDYPLGVRHGIIYGDGTALRSAKRVKGFAVRMCGNSAELLEHFEGYPRSYPPSFGGDPVVYMFDAFAATHDLKSLPADDESESYKLGFIRGLLAADGSVSDGSQVTLCGSKDLVDWLKTNGEQLGFIVQRVAIMPSTTNFGERTRDTFSVHLHHDGLVPEDFLCSWKRANFRQLTSTYKVVGIEDNAPCPVYCAEVPDTNTFVLEGGIVTGNCSYVAVDHVRAFDEILYILMCGTGVGFSVERQFINNLPTVSEDFHQSDTLITVKDSKIGWASAFRELVSMLYAGQIPKWDVSKVRPAGAKLKTFGGRASGPKPLVDLFNFAVDLFKRAAGRKLTSVECHDLVCKIADIVVVGGVRRSALISLSNLSDDRMRVAKSGRWWETEPQRALANNSAAYTERPDMEIFLKEWQALIESKSGERGIFNRVAAKKKAAEFGRRDPNHEFGTNPCLHPDSMIETINGRVRIADITEPTMVYTMLADGSLGIRKASASWVSKKNADTLIITIASGKQVRCTPDHKIFIEGRGWVEAQDIRVGDRVVHLVRQRRGAAYSGVKLTTQPSRDFVMEHHLVWSAVNGPVPEGLDIHHIDGDTYNNSIDNLECLTHEAHARLTALEQPNDHQVRDSGGRFITHPNSRGGSKAVVPMPEALKSNLHQYATVVSIAQGERVDVYDLTVEDTHNFIADFVVVHNCGEIVLRSAGLCNLTEVVIRTGDTLDDLMDKVEVAAIMGTFQSSLTNYRYVRNVWKRNAEEERLLGVSMTGIMDHGVLSKPSDEAARWLTQLREHAVKTNAEWAKKLGINASAAITTVKPSGTVSQLVDSASGIHPRYSRYYVRTVRADKKDPLARLMRVEGFPVEDCVIKPETTDVFSFPVRGPEHAVFRNDMPAIQQLEHYLMFKRFWCEHNPSITVYVRDHEWLAVGDWVYNNFDDIGGVSFLPHTDHVYQQAPYTECSEAEYEELASRMPAVDWSKLREFEREDATTGTKELACSAGACEIL